MNIDEEDAPPLLVNGDNNEDIEEPPALKVPISIVTGCVHSYLR